MGKQILISDASNKARRVHTVMLGDQDSKARKVVKAFIGGNDNLARCVHSPEIEAYGIIDPLASPRARMAAVTIGDYAFFGGGSNADTRAKIFGSPYHDCFYTAYSKHLTKLTSNHGIGKYAPEGYDLAATTLGNLAFFGGGRWHPDYSRLENAGDTVSYSSSKEVKVYDSSLTRVAVLELSKNRHALATTTVGNYALFAGGMNCIRNLNAEDSNSTYSYEYLTTVDAFGTDLVRLSAPALSTGRGYLAAAKVIGHALFAGGMHREDFNSSRAPYDTNFLAPTTKAVDVYNEALTKVDVSQLYTKTCCMTAVSTEDRAIFFGGLYHVSGSPINGVDISTNNNMLYSSLYNVHRYSNSLTYEELDWPGSGTNTGAPSGVGIGAAVVDKDGKEYVISAGGRDLSSEMPYSWNASNYTNDYFYNSKSGVAIALASSMGVTGDSLSDLSIARSYLAAAVAGDYAIFAGGGINEYSKNSDNKDEATYSGVVEAYKI